MTIDPAVDLPDDTAAQKRADRMELVLQATNEGHWDWNLVTGKVYFSPRWKEMLGYTDAEIPNRVAEWWDRMHPDDRAMVNQVLQDYLAGQRATYEVEHRLRHKDGSWRWIVSRGISVRDGEGRIFRIVGAHQDVTDRRRAEEEVRRRDAILDAVRFMSERFLSDDLAWPGGALSVLQRLGEATAVSRVYIFENITGEDGGLYARNMDQWSAPGVPDSNPELQVLSYRELGNGRWYEVFRRGEIIHTHTRDLPDDERPGFEEEGTKSFVIVPIVVNDAWWGFVGFDECVEEREFSAPELDALKAAAQTLGAAVARSKANETLAWMAAIVESSDDAIIGETLDRRIISWNRGAERLYGYRAEEVLGQSMDILVPADEKDAMHGVFSRVAHSGHVDAYETERLRKDGSRVAVTVSLSPVRNRSGETIGAAAIARDISARKRQEEALRRSKQSLSTLLANLPGMAYRSIPGTPWRIDFVSEGAQALTGYTKQELEASRPSIIDLIDPEERPRLREEIEVAIAAGEPFHLTYPIETKSGERKWVMDQGRRVRDVAGAAIAIEGIIMDITDRVRARQLLEQRVAERTKELSTLLEISTSIASTTELEPLLGEILEHLGDVLEYSGAAIFALDGDDHLRLLDYRGPLGMDVLTWSWPLERSRHSREVVSRREPIIIPDIHAETPLAAAYRERAVADLGEVPGDVGAWMGVPLMLRDRVIGLLAVDHSEPHAWTDHHAEIAMAFASHAAVALENAQLFAATQEKAALEERQRLARELHDSVSQALFGIGLGARTARTVIEDTPAKAIAPLDYVLSLAEAGLAEMRALIFELRPEALQEEGIVAALQKQAAALRARYGVEVEARLDDVGDLPLESEEALYRIAQEAMHNTVKHARAMRVRLSLRREDACVRLVVQDNGKGFDASGSFPGHLGLHTMRDRAERLGGSFDLASAPGDGARIEVCVPVTAPARAT